MPLSSNVSLQISLSPGDYPMARYMLPHQLKQVAGQVNEVIITIDTRPSKGRFADGWHHYSKQLYAFIEQEIKLAYRVQVIPVDYSEDVKKKISSFFIEQGIIPDKDFRGGPFYAYFFGLYRAANNIVFHLDADIFLGGGSQSWISDAVQQFEQDASVLIVSPLPGPPHEKDVLIGQTVIQKPAPYTFHLEGMSTRLFMIDKARFNTAKLIVTKPGIRNQIKAIIEGNPNADLPEHIILAYIKNHGLKRVDLLGLGTGLWSLHPPYRTTTFYNALPKLIHCVEQNNLPQAQQGFYDIIDDVCDWTEAREKLKQQRWWKRIFKKG